MYEYIYIHTYILDKGIDMIHVCMYVFMYVFMYGFGSEAPNRFRAKREQPKRLSRPLPESQGQNMALTVLSVPNSLDSG